MRVAAVVVLLAGLGVPARADGGSRAAEPVRGGGERPRVALALSGGGARGIAHIGALRALEDAGIPVDAIAATSMGAVIGGIYATGRQASELEEIVLSVDWRLLFSGRPDRASLPVTRRVDRYGTIAGVGLDWKGLQLPAAAVAERRVNHFLISWLAPAGWAAKGDFGRLPIPFHCVATALDDGERVVLGRGDLALAVRASMSIPIAFPPVDWKGRPLVDGLVVDNVPVDVARGFGAAVVVAVDVERAPLEPDEYEDALGVATQVANLLTARRNADFAAEPDVLIEPDLGRHSVSDYSDFAALIAEGYRTAAAAIPRIREKLREAGIPADPSPAEAAPSAPPVDPSEPASDPPSWGLDGTPVVAVEVVGLDRLSEKLVRRLFDVPIGSAFVLEKALRAFERVQTSGLIDRAWMAFEEVPAGLRVVLRIQEAPPNRAEVGAAFTEWEKARGVVRFLNRNTLGFGEQTELLLVASDAESVGRLSLRGDRLFLLGLGYRATGFLETDKPRFFDEAGDIVNRAEFNRRGVDAALQVPVRQWGLVEGGFVIGSVNTEGKPGIVVTPGTDAVRLLRAAVVIDDVDSLRWPRRGRRLAVEGEWSVEGLGASRPYWRFLAEGTLGQRLRRRLGLRLDAMAGLSGDELPVYEHFRLGGPSLVPGYHHEQLKGPRALAASATLSYRMVGPLRVFGRVGAGNVFERDEDMSFDDARWGVGIGAVYPSRFGPLAAELAVRDGGHSLLSIAIGWH